MPPSFRITRRQPFRQLRQSAVPNSPGCSPWFHSCSFGRSIRVLSVSEPIEADGESRPSCQLNVSRPGRRVKRASISLIKKHLRTERFRCLLERITHPSELSIKPSASKMPPLSMESSSWDALIYGSPLDAPKNNGSATSDTASEAGSCSEPAASSSSCAAAATTALPAYYAPTEDAKRLPDLPLSLQLSILQFLNVESLASIRQVDRAHRDLLSSSRQQDEDQKEETLNAVWKPACQRQWNWISDKAQLQDSAAADDESGADYARLLNLACDAKSHALDESLFACTSKEQQQRDSSRRGAARSHRRRRHHDEPPKQHHRLPCSLPTPPRRPCALPGVTGTGEATIPGFRSPGPYRHVWPPA